MDEKYTNTANNIEAAEKIESQLMGNLQGSKVRKKWRKQYLETLASDTNTSYDCLKTQLENKHNGLLPRGTNKSACSYVAADILAPENFPVTFTNHPEPNQLLKDHKDISGKFGYSYGRAAEPSTFIQTQFANSGELNERFKDMSESIQLFFKVISDNFQNEKMQQILFHKAPASVTKSFNLNTKHTNCYTTRPDVILSADGRSLQITELEGAPGGHGIFASQEFALYNESHLVTGTKAFLDGRPYRVIINPDWVAYTFEQAAFCNMLQEEGVDAKVIITGTPERFQEDIMKHRLYDYRGPVIQDALTHIKSDIFKKTINFKPNLSSKETKDTVLFRFGYFNNFTAQQIQAMEAADTVTNSMLPYLESKNVLALAHSPTLKEIYLANGEEEQYQTLVSFVTPTQIAGSTEIPQTNSVIKLSGWDENAWGARSVYFGEDHTAEQWKGLVSGFVTSNLPAVSQQAISSHKFNLNFITPSGKQKQMFDANIRLTPIIVDGKIGVIGSTFRTEKKVHSGTNSVMGIIR